MKKYEYTKPNTNFILIRLILLSNLLFLILHTWFVSVNVTMIIVYSYSI